MFRNYSYNGKSDTSQAFCRRIERKFRSRLVRWVIRWILTVTLYLYFWDYAWWVPWTLTVMIPLGLLSLFGNFYLRRKQLELAEQMVALERLADLYSEEE